jgi:hypothetical protein
VNMAKYRGITLVGMILEAVFPQRIFASEGF